MQFKDSNGITFLQFDNITWFNSLNRILRHQRGASNNPIQFKSACEIGPLLELHKNYTGAHLFVLAKFL